MVDVDQLAGDIEAFLGTYSHPDSAGQAAQEWGQAYESFALGAQDASGEGPAVVNRAGFEEILEAHFGRAGAEGLGPGPGPSAQAFADAFVAFWTGAVFQFGVPPVGGDPGAHNGLWSIEASSMVFSVTGAPLKAALQILFESPSLTPSSTASAIAGAFSNATTQDVLVQLVGTDTTPTPSGPLPITLTDTLS